jgi:hypothetical protein
VIGFKVEPDKGAYSYWRKQLNTFTKKQFLIESSHMLVMLALSLASELKSGIKLQGNMP